MVEKQEWVLGGSGFGSWDNKRLADRGLWRRLRESGLKRDAAVRRENGGTGRLAGPATAWRC